jgi:hypothetical protein
MSEKNIKIFLSYLCYKRYKEEIFITVYIIYAVDENKMLSNFYHIDTKYDSAIKYYKENWKKFILLEPKKECLLQLQMVKMSRIKYNKLCDLATKTQMMDESGIDIKKELEELKDIVEKIYKNTGCNTKTIICSNGYSDFWNVVKYYVENFITETESENLQIAKNINLYEIACVDCGEEFYIDQGMLDEGVVNCPVCNVKLHITYDDMDDENIESEDIEDVEDIAKDEEMIVAYETLKSDSELFLKVLNAYIDNF